MCCYFLLMDASHSLVTFSGRGRCHAVDAFCYASLLCSVWPLDVLWIFQWTRPVPWIAGARQADACSSSHLMYWCNGSILQTFMICATPTPDGEIMMCMTDLCGHDVYQRYYRALHWFQQSEIAIDFRGTKPCERFWQDIFKQRPHLGPWASQSSCR